MLRSIQDLNSMGVAALDGDIGSIEDVYFDDATWTVRYLVVDTGRWLPGRKVLISPDAVQSLEWRGSQAALNLTRDQVRRSPDVDTDKPVSRQQELLIADYYGHGHYWSRPFQGGFQPPPPMTPEIEEGLRAARAEELANADPHLRSVREVSGYAIESASGKFGHVANLLFDSDSWCLRYLVVDTREWLPGKHVLVSLEFVSGVRWAERCVDVDLSRETIESNPDYGDFLALNQISEEALVAHYRLAKDALGERRQGRRPGS